MGWAQYENGALLRAAEQAGFEVFVTADQNIYYQQNNEARKIALVVLSENYWPRVAASGAKIRKAVEAAVPGSFIKVDIASE